MMPLAPVLLTAAMLLAPAPRAQEPGPEPTPAEPLLYAWCGGLDALFADPRDAGLLRALGMLDERLAELPAELGAEVPQPVLRLALDVLFRPGDLELRLTDMQSAGGEPPVELELRVFGDQALQASIDAGIEALLAMGGLAPQPVEGAAWKRIPAPVGSVLYGSLPAEVGRAGSFLSLGEPRFARGGTPSTELPDGVAPVLALELDTAPLRPYLEMAIGFTGEKGDFLFEVLDRSGLLSETPPSGRFALGHGADRMHCAGRYERIVGPLEAWGFLAREPIEAADLALIPSDANYASLARSSFDFLGQLVELLEEASGEDLHGKLEEALGLRLEEDVLAPLGTLQGSFMADSTGGGGILSLVVFLGLDDAERAGRTLDLLCERLSALAAAEAKGYVAVRSWEDGGRRCRSLQFPGIPVPFEPSFAIHRDHLWVGASRQALLGALAQADAAAAGDAGLAGAPRFAESLAAGATNLSSLAWQDSAALLEDAYGAMMLATTALANAVRSPGDDSRDPGILLPAFPELARSARPMVSVSWVEGDDIVVRGEADRSVLVNATAMLGNPLLLAYGIAVGLSSAGQALEQANGPWNRGR